MNTDIPAPRLDILVDTLMAKDKVELVRMLLTSHETTERLNRRCQSSEHDAAYCRNRYDAIQRPLGMAQARAEQYARELKALVDIQWRRVHSPLFHHGRFKLHSGDWSSWKVECDALTPADWRTLAALVAERLTFYAVVGVPRGGLPFAEALAPYVSDHGDSYLIVDDVLTSGPSMEEMRRAVDGASYPNPRTRGVVAFARGQCPSWVQAIWQWGLGE